MRWLLVRFCGLALINLSVALNKALQVTQKPRFYGMKPNQTVRIYCASNQPLPVQVEWYKANMDAEEKTLIKAGPRIKTRSIHPQITLFILSDLHIEDSGVYFCKLNNTFGSGTGLQVATPINLREAQYRSKMKDGLIIFQGLLLAVFIAAILQRKQSLLKDRDSLYEEPETDHIYEGLAIETCGGGLYEELSVYAQAEGGEAPWE